MQYAKIAYTKIILAANTSYSCFASCEKLFFTNSGGIFSVQPDTWPSGGPGFISKKACRPFKYQSNNLFPLWNRRARPALSSTNHTGYLLSHQRGLYFGPDRQTGALSPTTKASFLKTLWKKLKTFFSPPIKTNIPFYQRKPPIIFNDSTIFLQSVFSATIGRFFLLKRPSTGFQPVFNSFSTFSTEFSTKIKSTVAVVENKTTTARAFYLGRSSFSGWSWTGQVAFVPGLFSAGTPPEPESSSADPPSCLNRLVLF